MGDACGSLSPGILVLDLPLSSSPALGMALKHRDNAEKENTCLVGSRGNTLVLYIQ